MKVAEGLGPKSRLYRVCGKIEGPNCYLPGGGFAPEEDFALPCRALMACPHPGEQIAKRPGDGLPDWRQGLRAEGPVRFALVEKGAARQDPATDTGLDLVAATVHAPSLSGNFSSKMRLRFRSCLPSTMAAIRPRISARNLLAARAASAFAAS